MILIAKKNFHSIKQEWERIEKQKNNISPFQTYAFAENLYREYRILCGVRGVPEFYLLSENGIVLMICPVCRSRFGKQPNYSSFGSKMGVIHEDFIYPDGISDEKLYECLCAIVGHIGTISFSLTVQNSRLYSIASQKEMIRNEKKHLNMAITLPESYEAYYKSLSKKMRQTLRTAQNRLNSENQKDEIQIYYGKEMPKFEYLKLCMLYANSKYDRYYCDERLAKRVFHWFYVVFLHHNARALNHIDASVCVEYKINNKSAAMLGGYLSGTGESVHWHRVGYDTHFSRYSPGILALQKTIEIMIHDTNVKFFDLSMGGEEYKSRLGAETYYDLCFDLVPLETE